MPSHLLGCGTFTDAHRATLDWLNEITDDSFEFFGLEVELWRIGDSPPAPKFNVVSKPNDWSRSVGEMARANSESPTPTRSQQLAFWSALRKRLEETDSPIHVRKTRAQNWMGFSIGRLRVHLGVLAELSGQVDRRLSRYVSAPRIRTLRVARAPT